MPCHSCHQQGCLKLLEPRNTHTKYEHCTLYRPTVKASIEFLKQTQAYKETRKYVKCDPHKNDTSVMPEAMCYNNNKKNSMFSETEVFLEN